MTFDLPDGLTAEQSRWNGTPEEDLQILRDLGDVDIRGKTGYKIVVSTDNPSPEVPRSEFKEPDEVARIEYYQFSTSNTGYIGWIEVAESYRGQGIGFEIRTAAMEHLLDRGVDTVYTGQLSDGGKALATRHGFQPVQDGPLAGDFYVYRR